MGGHFRLALAPSRLCNCSAGEFLRQNGVQLWSRRVARQRVAEVRRYASRWSVPEVKCYNDVTLHLLLSMTPVWSSALVALSVATQVAVSPATQRHPFHEPLPSVEERLKGPASRFANLSPTECRKQLKLTGELGKAFKAQGPTNGIANPMRFVGPLGSVKFQVPPLNTTFGLLDCRQALLWIQLLPLLEKHKIAKIRIDNFYRNGARISQRGKKSQHSYGLAADVVSMTLTDGRDLDVKEDFLGQRGEPPCGPKAAIRPRKGTTSEQVEEAIIFRNFVCELASTGSFHHILTPNYNKAHESHLHLDLKRDNKWFSVD